MALNDPVRAVVPLISYSLAATRPSPMHHNLGIAVSSPNVTLPSYGRKVGRKGGEREGKEPRSLEKGLPAGGGTGAATTCVGINQYCRGAGGRAGGRGSGKTISLEAGK